jgi:hypothetical protein
MVLPMAPAPLPTAEQANRVLRAFANGRLAWTPEALAELDRLRAVWREAVRRELTTAA